MVSGGSKKMAKFNLRPGKKKAVVKGNNSHHAAVNVNSVGEFHWMIDWFDWFVFYVLSNFHRLFNAR